MDYKGFAVMQSIHPKYCELIADGKKTVEIRKNKPKELAPPFTVYIYCCKPKKILRYVLGDENDQNRTFVKISDGSTVFCSEPYVGKVIGEYVCDKIYRFLPLGSGRYISRGEMGFEKIEAMTCLTQQEMQKYGEGKILYGWHISDVIIYDKPCELNNFYIPCKHYYAGDGCYDNNCPLYETPSYEYGEIDNDCEGEKPIRKAPQSWFYVGRYIPKQKESQERVLFYI